MKLSSKLGMSVAAVAVATASAAYAATDLVVVSWGGAYSASQQNAYHEPYMKRIRPSSIINDDSLARPWPSCAP